MAELAPDLSPYRYAFNNPITFTDLTGMYEGGDGEDDSDRDEGYIRFHWNDNYFEGVPSEDYNLLYRLGDVFTLNWGVDFRSGSQDGDASHSDYMQDMSQENGHNDMRNDAVQDSYQNNGPGPRKGSSPGKGTNDIWGDGGNVIYNGTALFNSNYIGPGPDIDPNELLKSGLRPLDMVDLAAFNHDKAYYYANTGGVKGALLEKKIAYADQVLEKATKKIMIAFKQGKIDPVTGEKISQRTYNMAEYVHAAFKAINIQKSVRINIDTIINQGINQIRNSTKR